MAQVARKVSGWSRERAAGAAMPFRAELVFLATLLSMLGLVAALPSVAVRPAAAAAADLRSGNPRDCEKLREDAVAKKTPLWNSIVAGQLSPNASSREIVGYALALAQANQHPERLPTLVGLLVQMQDRRSGSNSFGNLKWRWGDSEVTDQNAVDFCMQDALLLWLRYRDWMPPDAQQRLYAFMQYAGRACYEHRASASYTNIALLNASDLLLWGEASNQPELAAEGSRRLEAIGAWTAAYGTHEVCSPTYYGIDLNALMSIATESRAERPRQQADELLRLLWTDIAINWFPAAERLGGCYSRTSDFLCGRGALDWYLWVNGWITSPTPGKAERAEPFCREWSPPAELRHLSSEHLPRLVRQSWGQRPAESRTQMIYGDVSLSCLGATYGRQDVPLAVDLPGPRDAPRCYFIADGRGDPYGTEKYKTRAGSHPKALHLTPFWIGAQRTCDAVAVAIYRNKSLRSDEPSMLRSNFILRRDARSIWLHGAPVPSLTATGSAAVPMAVGDPLVLRYGTAAIGIRVVVASTRDGGPAQISLVDDGNPYGCLRLTIDHGPGEAPASVEVAFPQAAAGLWVRVGSGLNTDAAFDTWRRTFEATLPTGVELSETGVQIALPGVDGPVAVRCEAPYNQAARPQIVPAPGRGVLEVDGREVGRPLLTAFAVR
jgi:hypothetical protein